MDVTAAAPACPRCAAPALADDRFCEVCGAALAPGLAAGPDRFEIDIGALAGVSDRGGVRARNEDAMALGHGSGRLAAVVCDGVATTGCADQAARAAAVAALDVLRTGDGGEAGMRRAVAAAAAAVAPLARPEDRVFPACTLVAATVDRAASEPPVVTVGWVGDSRTYWLADPPRLLTTDHAAGRGITRWLGSDPELAGVLHDEPDVVTFAPDGPGALLLCTDGLWGHRPDPVPLARLVAITGGNDALAAARALVESALDAGGLDNITAVVVPVLERSRQ